MGADTQRKIFFYLLACLLSVGIFFGIYFPFDFSIPLAYQDDGLFTSITIKTVADTGWYLTNSALGFPGIYNFADYPVAETISLCLVKLTALFSQNYAVVMNVFYLLTFPLITLISLPVFQRCGLNKPFALVASLLFTFLPYHLLRGQYHLFLTTYYVVPIVILLALAVYQKDFSWKNNFYLILLCLVTASSGVYYAFFGAYFILIASLLGEWDKKRVRRAVIFIAIICVTLAVNISPSLIEKTKSGPNKLASYRGAMDSETYGLKITQLIFPVNNHHLRGFAKSKSHYNKTAPLVNENAYATLGLIGSVGFLSLLITLLFKIENPLFFLLSRLNIFAVLLGTVGGLGAVFAYRVSPMIRSYNRISVFIAFFALCGFFLILQIGLKKWGMDKKIVRGLLTLILLTIGLFDQIPTGLTATHAQIEKDFLNDQAFIARIEKILPAGSAVFQLPFMVYPESNALNNMRDYDPARAFLHSTYLRWSYGAINGRETSAKLARMSQLPITKMLAELKKAGFVGIYVDRKGYQDNAQDFEKNLQHFIHKQPEVSADQRFVFYDLR